MKVKEKGCFERNREKKLCTHTESRNFAPGKGNKALFPYRITLCITGGYGEIAKLGLPLKKLRKEESYDVYKFRNDAYALNGSSINSMWLRVSDEEPRIMLTIRAFSMPW